MITKLLKNLLSPYEVDDLDKVREVVTNRSMKLACLIFGVLLVFAFVRYLEHPNPLFWSQVFCYLSLVAVSFFVPNLSYRWKIHFFLGVFLIVITLSYFYIGVIAYSAPMLLFVTMVSLFVLGIRWAFTYMAVGIGIQLLFSYLYLGQFLTYSVDVESLVNSPSQWYMAIGSHLFISLLVLLIVYGIYRFLEESMLRYKQSSLELEDKNRQLQQEMSHRKLMEEKLRQTQKLETLGTLSGGIAHDFNNILTPILGYTSLAMKQLDDGNPVKEDLTYVLKGARRARDLVKQILTFSRRQEIQNSCFNLGELAEESIKFVSQTISKNIKIECELEPSERSIHADPTQIQQVIINLLTNASQAIDGSGGTIVFKLQYRKPSPEELKNIAELELRNYAVMKVIDDGEGIPEDHLVRIFDPFFTTKAPGEGTGLGLSVVHGILMSHGGAISVSSELSKYTEFKVFLKTDDSTRNSLEGEEIPEKVAGLRILVLDDEEDILDYTVSLLSADGNTVEVFKEPERALEIIRTRSSDFDLLITDLMMPGMGGVAFISELRSLGFLKPIVLWSGSMNLDQKYSEQELLGPVVKIRKPFEKSELYSAIGSIL